MTGPTDWDRELKYIVREFDGLPAAPPSSLEEARKKAEKHKREQRGARTAMMGVWARAAIVAALAVGLYFWPYAKTCGIGLFGYLGAAVLIGVGAMWVVTLSWSQRLPRAHAAGMLLVLASLALLGNEILPRVGYAKTDPTNPPRWVCK